MDQKAADVEKFKKAKEAQDVAKAAIVARAIERKMQEQLQQQEMEGIRQELLEEEVTAELRRKELEDLEKRHRQMLELRAAAEQAIRLRQERLAFEKKEEDDYRKQV